MFENNLITGHLDSLLTNGLNSVWSFNHEAIAKLAEGRANPISTRIQWLFAHISKELSYSLDLGSGCVIIFLSDAGTVRRFLEHHGSSFDIVIFAVDNTDLGIYEVLLPLYFPRSKFEEDAARWQLPSDIGGHDGEPMLPDRQIRIIDNPQHTLHGELARGGFSKVTEHFRNALVCELCRCH